MGERAPASLGRGVDAGWCVRSRARGNCRAIFTSEAAAMGEGGKRRVLVVDDDARVRRMACVALRHHGFDVVDAGDGASGLALARSAAPDLALVDIELGDMNGLALVAELRADPATARLPVLVMSGALVGGDERRGRDAPRAPGCGPLEYLAKPFGAADLVARIEGLLAAR